MNRTILEEKAVQLMPPPAFHYVEPASISVRVSAPRWTWIARICHEIPEGKCVMFLVPEGRDAEEYSKALRLALSMSRHTLHERFSIRRSLDGSYLVVLKAEAWADYYKRMEATA